MKTISPTLLTAIESGNVATLIKVTLVNGDVYGYTDHDIPLTVGGILYTPAAGQSVLKMSLTSDATVSFQDVVAAWTPVISEQALLEGLYDFAAVEFALCAWGSAQTSYPQTVLTDKPVAFWMLNETSGTTAYDSSGNGYNGTYTGGFTLGQPGIPAGGNGVKFDGSSGCINLPNISALGTSFTLEGWYKTSTTGTRQAIISLGGIPQNEGVFLFINTGNSLETDLSDVAGPSGGTASPVSNWTLAHVVFTSGSAQLYLNGVAVGSAVGMSPSITQAGVNQIAYDNGAAVQQDHFSGYLSNIAVYNTALSAARIQAHYKAGSG